jgi:hypothetical protein
MKRTREQTWFFTQKAHMITVRICNILFFINCLRYRNQRYNPYLSPLQRSIKYLASKYVLQGKQIIKNDDSNNLTITGIESSWSGGLQAAAMSLVSAHGTDLAVGSGSTTGLVWSSFLVLLGVSFYIQTLYFGKRKDYNFACGSIGVWNMVSDSKRRIKSEGVWEQGAEDNIWAKEGWSDGRVVKTA